MPRNVSGSPLRGFPCFAREPSGRRGELYSAFVLALALCNAPPAPLDLVSESFERVHWLAEKEQLRDEAWFILQPLVPELSWGKTRDVAFANDYAEVLYEFSLIILCGIPESWNTVGREEHVRRGVRQASVQEL